jgi:small-conductance mechanosensitive channel
MNFEIRCRLRDVNYTLTVHSDLNFAIVERFRAEGIQIPLPQRDLHIRGLDRLAGTLPPPLAAAKEA